MLTPIVLCWLAAVGAPAAVSGWDVVAAGACRDGTADATAVFQQLLDEAGAAGGGVVTVPAGRYRIDSRLRIPEGVTLEGTFRTAPTGMETGAIGQNGSILLVSAGRGEPDGEAVITLAGNMAVLDGFIITYPDWRQADVPPIPYSTTVASTDTLNVGVMNCCFLGSYEAIRLIRAHRHLVRNVNGYPSKRGLYVDECYDIGRVENIHFWPFGVSYQHDDPYCKWVNTEGVAFEFARTDWQYVVNTFCFGYGAGYKFSESSHGSCNGNFLGLGADSCRRAVLVEQGQWPGLLITNGEFVGRWGSTDSVCIEIAPTSERSKVSLTNCSFWGPIDRCIWARSVETQLTVNACNLCDWDNTNSGSPAIQIDAGKAIIQGNTFGNGDTHVAVGEGASSVIIMGNQADDGFRIVNDAGDRVQLLANESDSIAWTKRAKEYYRVDIGAPGDRRYIRSWHGREPFPESGIEGATKRWSGADSILKLPVRVGKTYALTLDVWIPEPAVADENGLYLGETRVVDLPAQAGFHTVEAELPRTTDEVVVLTLRVKAWRPADVNSASTDMRMLGVGVGSLTLRAKGARSAVFDANTGQWIDGERDRFSPKSITDNIRTRSRNS